MHISHRWALGLRALAVAVPVMACCCPALPMASQQTDALLQIAYEADPRGHASTGHSGNALHPKAWATGIDERADTARPAAYDTRDKQPPRAPDAASLSLRSLVQ